MFSQVNTWFIVNNTILYLPKFTTSDYIFPHRHIRIDYIHYNRYNINIDLYATSMPISRVVKDLAYTLIIIAVHNTLHNIIEISEKRLSKFTANLQFDR